MKNIVLMGIGILVSSALVSCSKTVATSACSTAGYYADQSECQNSVSLGSCASTTVPSGESTLVCWKASTTSNQTGNTFTNTNTNTNTGTGCTGQSPPWTMGAWSPSSCGAGITQRTRTVTCDYGCPCDATKPSTTETCTPNMFGGKHYESECTTAGGALEWIEGNRVCRMNGASCGNGWAQVYYNTTPYTITSAASAEEHVNCFGKRKTVSTGSHNSFIPAKAVESLLYCSSRNCFGCKTWSTLNANINHVACY